MHYNACGFAVHNTPNGKPFNMPIDARMDREIEVCSHNEMLYSNTKIEITIIHNSMDKSQKRAAGPGQVTQLVTVSFQ